MIPVAISRQNSRCTARDGSGRPGDRIAGRNARSAAHCLRAPSGTRPSFVLPPIATSVIKVLRRPVESTRFTPRRMIMSSVRPVIFSIRRIGRAVPGSSRVRSRVR